MLVRPVLLFDLGDTLVRYYRREEFPPLLQAGIQAAKKELEHAGHDLPSERDIARRVAAENYESKNSRVRPLHKRLGRIFSVDLTDENWLPVCRAFLGPIFSIAAVYEDTHPALDSYLADGYRVGVLSNCPWGAPSEPWFEELQRHGLAMRCEVAIFCSDVGWRKPAQPMFRHALDHFGCNPEECIFVGDNPRWDIVGAQRANMTSVLIDRSGLSKAGSGGLVIRSLLDLRSILE